jgi:hypothetical protein
MLSVCEEQIQSLERKFKIIESTPKISLPQNFADDLGKELEELGAHIPNDNCGYLKKVVICQFLADAYMAGQIESC